MKPTKEYLEKKFKEYNKQYFNNVLPKCKMSVTYINATGRYTYNKQQNLGHIWLSARIDNNEEFIKEVLIHEMIHHYIKTIEHREGGLFGHNWRFRRQCRRLFKEHNLKIRITVN